MFNLVTNKVLSSLLPSFRSTEPNYAISLIAWWVIFVEKLMKKFPKVQDGIDKRTPMNQTPSEMN